MTIHLGLMLSIVSALPVAFSQMLKAPETATDPYTLNVAVDEVKASPFTPQTSTAFQWTT
jgi:hypothetical protein